MVVKYSLTSQKYPKQKDFGKVSLIVLATRRQKYSVIIKRMRKPIHFRKDDVKKIDS